MKFRNISTKTKVIQVVMALVALMLANSVSFAGRRFALAGYKMDGSLDQSFGQGGKIVTDFPNISNAQASAMAVNSSQRVIVAGRADGLFALARYYSNGSLDTNFGNSGRVTTDFTWVNDNQPWNGANAIAIDQQGRILVAGTAAGKVALARYNSNGSLDLTFDNDGKVVTGFFPCDFDWCSQANAIAIDQAGKILVAGTAVRKSPVSPGEKDEMFVLARYNENGSLDETFNNKGWITFNALETPCVKFECDQPETTEERANGIAIDANGGILVAGGMRHIAYGNNAAEPYYFWGAFIVFRYLPNGTLDTSFSDDINPSEDGWTYIFETGLLNSAQTLPTSEAQAISVDNNGKIVVAGKAVSGNGIETFAVARLQLDGTLDTTFAGGGKDNISYWGWIPAQATAIKIESSSTILAAGRAQTANAKLALARWLPAGALDTSFNDDGLVLTDFCQGNEGITALATPRLHQFSLEKRIVAAGWADDEPLP